MTKAVVEEVLGGVVGGVVRKTDGSTTCWSEGSYSSLFGRFWYWGT